MFYLFYLVLGVFRRVQGGMFGGWLCRMWEGFGGSELEENQWKKINTNYLICSTFIFQNMGLG